MEPRDCISPTPTGSNDMKTHSSNLILCYGEVLWDCLPQGLFLGGAPLNVAYHLRRLGQNSQMISAVGHDLLGDETKRRLTRWGFSIDLLSTSKKRPTGTVRVDVGPRGQPKFEIIREVAWDDIQLSSTSRILAPRALAVVFGSLAQRSENNRRKLQELLRLTEGALRIFDVNLRPPFDPSARVLELCREADVIKLNDQELQRFVGASKPLPLELRARRFAERTACQRICVTAGARGAGALWDGKWFWENARPVNVVDTVGAGDAFLAGFLNAWTQQAPVGRCLQQACRLAEYVAARPGAQPE